ncbi:MAG: DHH family phosphoesterase [Selenomonadaceae bacterium]|nr:DHH family phosphoesterase [Selenomonadaceae bacterium]
MPKNLSAWLDLVICLVVMAALIAVLYMYNPSLASMAAILWLSLAVFARERCAYRQKKLTRYADTVIGSVGEMVVYATEKIPHGILMINKEGRIEWTNDSITDFLDKKPEMDTDINVIWPDLNIEEIWGEEGEFVFPAGSRFFRVRHRMVKDDLMALYIRDVTRFEELKTEYKNNRAVVLSLQIDNFDEVTQGLTETEHANLLMAVRKALDEWLLGLGGLIRRVREDLYMVLLTRSALDKAIAEKFEIMDKIRQIEGANGLPVTISAGGAIAGEEDRADMAALDEEAKAKLDLALGRGGDQVAIMINGKTQFFGGRAKAVERHTRVKARVVALACREIMEAADVIYVMGHVREDFDAFGAAMGVARMARHLKKEVHIILSNQTTAIAKAVAMFEEKEEYKDLFIRADEVDNIIALSPVLFIVDVHVPNIFAVPNIAQKIPKIVVIDHHRRSENFVKNPLLVYLEPSASSSSELVTELILYFSEHMKLGKLEATALYSGIVVDTKNFAVQTGVRTFEAAAYLRRAGADPVSVRQMFKQDYDATIALAAIMARAKYNEGGLIVSVAPEFLPNMQVLAAQAADALLTIENVSASIVIFPLKNAVGISARSTGDLNVQVIMEHFGGGGHQNVAAAQIEGGDIEQIEKEVVDFTKGILNGTKE